MDDKLKLLHRPFKIIAFDWDGTAVRDRREDATPVRQLLERLLVLGARIVVITGTNLDNVDRQLSAAIVGPHKSRLYVCPNRGSEVYGFDALSRPVLLWRRVATPLENRLLTEVANAVQQRVQARSGLEIKVIYNRLNRRKIDLIPLPEWQDPPKSRIGELLVAVQARLKGAGISGGLREVYELTREIAREKGLPDARTTSDVKHVEVGLTDKGSSVEWTMRNLAASAGIAPEDVLIAGDEFGPLAGTEGSDHRMVVPAAKGSVFVSVGVEPEGIGPEAIHLGGGPVAFRRLLEEQIALWERGAGVEQRRAEPFTIEKPEDSNWLLVEEGFGKAREHEFESLFTVANGYLGTRGSLPEGSVVSDPATFIAGLYRVGPEGSVELAAAPDWSGLRIWVAGEELRLDEGEILFHRRALDLRRGVLRRYWRHRDPAGHVTEIYFLRFVSLADRHALVEWVTIIPENYSATVAVDCTIEQVPTPLPLVEPASILEGDTEARAALEVDRSRSQAYPVLVSPIGGSEHTVALASATSLHPTDAPNVDYRLDQGPDRIVERWKWEAEIGRSYRIEKLVSVYTSRDGQDPIDAALRHVALLAAQGGDALLADHRRAWDERWAIADIEITGDADGQRAVRFAGYHLISNTNPEDDRVSIGARGLTGEAYKGHVFWDTDIYMLPFYVFVYPSAARSQAMYRYHTLPAARRKARQQGYEGALYAWESTDTGKDVTPPFALDVNGEVIHILNEEMEHHISADVAYGVWQYWRHSGDDQFFLDAGAEIIVETARFWASRVEAAEDGRYHIRGVIGPDEYHEGVDDDAYTNGMAAWNLRKAAEATTILAERWPSRWSSLVERLRLAPLERERWLAIAKAMYTGFDAATSIFEQFRGYYNLEYLDLKAFEPRTAPMDVLLGRERVAQTQVIKQPDVLLLMYLLWDDFEPAIREANFSYYEPRTGHGSSLSPSIHSLLAARLGYLDLAERYFRQSAEIDLANNMGNAAFGVHMAALGGLWQATVMGFGGLRTGEKGLAMCPSVPSNWGGLEYSVLHRGTRLDVQIVVEKETMKIGLRAAQPILLALGPAGEKKKITTDPQWFVTRRQSKRWALATKALR